MFSIKTNKETDNMNGFVKIKNGSYRNQEVTDQVFPLIKQFQLGSNGGFITVDGTGLFGKKY